MYSIPDNVSNTNANYVCALDLIQVYLYLLTPKKKHIYKKSRNKFLYHKRVQKNKNQSLFTIYKLVVAFLGCYNAMVEICIKMIMIFN